jgi:Phosphatase
VLFDPLDPLERRVPSSDRWRRGEYTRDHLAQALLEGRVAGPVTSHDRRNVLMKIDRLVTGEEEAQFGITGLAGPTWEEVLATMAEEAGFDPDPGVDHGPTAIDPYRVLAACEAAGERLARAAEQGERVLLATGHPAGLPLLYMAVGDLLERHGAKLLTPLDGFQWNEETPAWPSRHHRQIRYFRGVAVLTDRASTIHTHSPAAMRRMLEEVTPDLVFADHGFAGAAIERGIETISIADVNDLAPVVAKAQGRTELVIVMDDNVRPESYWPCLQAIASMFPADDGGVSFPPPGRR